jgi:hypothetical protein
MEQKIDIGEVYMTVGIQSLIAGSAMNHESPSFGEEVTACLRRHEAGDWGDLCDEDKKMNDEDAANGYGVLSMYITSNGKMYIKTDIYEDGPVTTVLLPEEY